MTDQAGQRQYRDLRSADVIVALAREGVPLAAIARALAIPTEQASGAVSRAVGEGRLKVRPRADWDDDSLVRRLRQRITELEGEVEEWERQHTDLEGADGDEKRLADMRTAFGLSRSEAALLRVLLDRGTIGTVALYQLLYGGRADEGPSIRVLRVFVHKVRRKLADAGFPGAIETRWGMGFTIGADSIRAINERLKERSNGEKDED